MFNRKLALALVVILSLVFSGVALAQTNISNSVTTVPADSIVMDYGMVPLDANTTEINGCAYVVKLDSEVGSITVLAPEGYVGDITLGVSGDKTNGYYISVEDTVSGYTAVIDEAYFAVGNNARKFTFDPSITYAGPLPAPLNPRGNSADISHTFFCYDLIQDEPSVCQEETAFGGSSEGAGNAWWFYYDASIGGVQTVWAGRTNMAGTVELMNGVLYIVLNENWELQNVDEPVKIQGYNTLPLSRPAAGLFTTYKGTSLTVPVDAFPYYVIHLDVQYCAPMP